MQNGKPDYRNGTLSYIWQKPHEKDHAASAVSVIDLRKYIVMRPEITGISPGCGIPLGTVLRIF